MNLSDIGAFAAKYAPLLGEALSSPVGAVAAIGSVVASAFGGNTQDPQDLLKKMQGDPEAQAKLLAIENDYKIQCQQIIQQGISQRLDYEKSMYETEVADRNSARQANNANGKRDIMPEILSILIVLGFYAAIFAVFQVHDDSVDKDILYMMLGILGSGFTAVLNYYLGSSSSSRRKDESISNMTKQIKV